MTFSAGSNTLASDYNSLTGGADITSAFGSDAAATAKAAALWGVGYGSRGYGQTTPSIPPVSAGGVIYASQWANLRTILSNMASFQGTSQATLPAASKFVAGAAIDDADGTAMSALLSTLDSNRLSTNGGASMTYTTNALNVTRGSTWGTSNSSIATTVQINFASEDATRYFFNSGGQLRFTLTHPNTSTSQDSNWNSALNSIGLIAFTAWGFYLAGSTYSSFTYYNLTTAFQTLYSAVIGTGAYSANTLTIKARSVAIAGANGAKGNQLQFQFTLTDAHTNANYDIVQAGTNLSCGHLRATSVLTGINAPTFQTIAAF